MSAIQSRLDAWLFQLRGPEALPVRLHQRRVFVLPTPAGLAYAMVLLLMLTGAINYNLSLGYLLTFLLGGLGLVTILHTFSNLLGLEAVSGRVNSVTAGEAAHFKLQFRSDKARPALEITTADHASLFSIAAAGQWEAEVAVTTHRRGWQRPGRITVATRFPLGLIRAWSYITPDLSCLVLPRPEIDPPPLPLPLTGEGMGAEAGLGSEDFAGLRKHQNTDSPRHVAWKSVARGLPMMTKQFSGHAASRLWLEWSHLPPQLDVEARLSRLTAWLLLARSAGLACGLKLPDQEFPPNQDDAHYQACLKALALYGLESDGNWASTGPSRE